MNGGCNEQKVHEEQEDVDSERIQEGLKEDDRTERREEALRQDPHLQDGKRSEVLLAVVKGQDSED